MPHLALLPFLWTALQTPAAATRAAARQPGARPPVSVEALPNDNRQAAGRLEAGVLRLRLEARIAAWRPNGNAVDTAVTVQAFAETGSTPRIPGPLLRGAAGTAVVATVHNALDSTLVLHGLRAGTTASDTLQIPAGATREVRFRLGAPGTYMYWGTTTNSPVHDRPWRDSQLTGAIVVDPPGVPPDTTERIFVITVLDLYPQDTLRNKAKEDVFDRAINGRSWPHGERLAYTVGDTVRWRWINGSYLPHPMHLHGFHFRVTARGEGNVDSTYAPGAERTVVTEFMVAGSTFRMQWVPTRAGNWLMHCHMRPHVVPFPERPDSVRAHDAHDSDALERHPLDAMQGLVLGVTVVDRPGAAASAAPAIAQRLRVLAQQAPSRKGRRAVPKGYVLQRGAEPVPDSVEVPGSPLVLVRGETTAITVVNRLRAATTVHWHGMELESVYDGVSGWSRTAGSIAPLIAPGDSFTVTMTPPRAGTFIYHTHMDEEDQLATGLYGPLLVVEPGDRWDPATDLVFMLGTAVERDTVRFAINGRAAPPPRELRAGTTYRLRFVNIHAAAPAMVELLADSTPLAWRPRAKDGADLPVAARAERPARLRRFGVGETWDFEWTPERPMDATLVVHMENVVLRQPLHVRAAAGPTGGQGSGALRGRPAPPADTVLARVEGQTMRLLVSGSGGPTIVLEAGFGGDHRTWSAVQPLLARASRVVSYDRMGLGGSGPATRPRTAAVIAEQLHEALRQARVAPPYLLVGHSFGGALVRVFAARYPTEVTGLVLVDPAMEDFYVRAALEQPAVYLAELEEGVADDWRATEGVRGEALAYETSMVQARLAPVPTGVPVTLLSATEMQLPVQLREIWLEEQRRWVERQPGARLVPVDNGHGIPQQRSEVVVRAVRETLEAAAGSNRQPPRRAPVIDMHLHAHSLADYGGGGPVCGNAGALEFPAVDPRNGISPASELATCPRSSLLQPAATDEALMRESIAMLERYDIVLAMTTGRLDRVSAWRAAAPDRIRPATYFNPPSTRTPGELRRLVALDSVAAFAEISAQYEGMTLDDPRLEPFFALAEELDVPVGVHLGEGPAGGPHTLGGSPYRARLGSPFQLEEVLTRHPRLRVWVMHYGSPLVDEMIAVLYSHPQVYVDVAQNDWGFPRAHFYGQLRRLVDAGFAKRILWGSDQMIWPGAIRLAIETIEQAPFLTDAQKRDILYNNAARFLRLSPDEIAKHHGRTLRRGDP